MIRTIEDESQRYMNYLYYASISKSNCASISESNYRRHVNYMLL